MKSNHEKHHQLIFFQQQCNYPQYFQKNHNLLLFLKDKKKLNSLKKKYQGKNSQIIKYEILDFDKFHNLKKKLEKNKNFIKNTNLIISTIGVQGEIKNFFDLTLHHI